MGNEPGEGRLLLLMLALILTKASVQEALSLKDVLAWKDSTALLLQCVCLGRGIFEFVNTSVIYF